MESRTPIFIISFNRPTMLRALINRLMELRQERIIIVDNNSTYEPLLEYYQEIQDSFEIIHVPMNHGCKIMTKLWKDKEFIKKYELDKINFIYTDCDIVPAEECPLDFVEKFNEILEKYRNILKVGFSIKIDDLPMTFKAGGKVVKWEAQFWGNKNFDHQLKVDLYSAPIDTTFSCQRANTRPGWTELSLRTGRPYTARHLPWYINENQLSEEDQHYLKTARPWEIHFPGRYFMWYKND
jgi:glycosyltransferase involved in cell wall biosynthesis